MCGIIGVVGCNGKLGEILLDGIKRLEYRGYDSAGIATVNRDKIITKKDIGKIDEVDSKVNFSDFKGSIGLAHTRWATNGGVTKENAHPHNDCKDNISIVHNGIIENFSELKEMLVKKGHKFTSSTDTEVVAHLIEDNYDENIEEATRKALKQIDGSYALGVICSKEPQKLIAARNESPLIVGLGNEENFIASDVPAILKHTNKVIYLGNEEIAILENNNHLIKNIDGKSVGKEVHEIDWDATYDYTEDVQFGANLGWFIPGDVFLGDDSGPSSLNGNDKMASQVIVHGNVNF